MLVNISKEFNKSPIMVTSGVTCTFVALLSLLIAWLQFQGISIKPSIIPNSKKLLEVNIDVGNALLVIAFFISFTTSAAIFIRSISRKHEFAAFFISVILASITNFLTILIIYLTPPRPLNQELFRSASELIIYASIFIYLVFCAQAVLKEFLSPPDKQEEDKPKSENDENSHLWGSLIIVIILFCQFGPL